MSETVYYTGKLTPVKTKTGETLEDTAKRIIDENNYKIESYYKTAHECFDDVYYREYITVNNKIYSVQNEDVDDNDDIFKATINEDGSINYVVKYYNGGCSFNEAIEEAMKPLTTPIK